jgi:hypothetical protein
MALLNQLHVPVRVIGVAKDRQCPPEPHKEMAALCVDGVLNIHGYISTYPIAQRGADPQSQQSIKPIFLGRNFELGLGFGRWRRPTNGRYEAR